jgi:hypothetical protein
MQQFEKNQERPALRVLAREGRQALAQLDADRLARLAVTCQPDIAGRGSQASEAREASSEIAVFARVLEATRVNLQVMRRMREMQGRRAEYDPTPECIWATMEATDGDN